MKNKSVLFLFLGLASFVMMPACKNAGSDEFTVSVSYKNLDKMVAQPGENQPKPGAAPRIMLQEIPYGGTVSIS